MATSILLTKFSLVLMLLLLSEGGDGSQIRCSNGFINNENSCYKFVDMAVSWVEATVFCNAMGAHLAEVESPVEEQFLLHRVYFVQSELRDKPLWLGASDVMNNDEWVWMHSKRVMGYRNWNMNRPEASPSGHGHCLAIQTQPVFAWVETACDQNLRFICEQEAL
ncbi:perlucin-like [Pomacea canaliculata]|uniref:perlucin-like n=1 Tax=Pomacea canaliculata TaxID=400727 RepID=UPI000D72714C|nr:perlucin-like [Pomacea canaliculata]